MRASYDCQIVGDDPAACLIASELASQGFRTLLRCEALPLSHDIEHWLVPATHETALALRRWQIPEACISPTHSQRNLQLVTQATSLARQMYLVDGAIVRQLFLERAQQAGAEVLSSELPPPAPVTLTVGSTEIASPAVIWGQYGQVQYDSLQSAQQFASSTGARLWLIPLDAERTSVGVCLTPTHYREGDLRTAWEDELVACPPLVQRLYDAQLEGPLRVRPHSAASHDVTSNSAMTYKPHCVPSPLDFSWDALFAASETARQIGANLRQTPVH